MNEAANFCNGECRDPMMPKQLEESDTEKDAEDETKEAGTFDPIHPPYAINNLGMHAPLNTKTLDMDAVHDLDIEYNVHNLFGAMEVKRNFTQILHVYYIYTGMYIYTRYIYIYTVYR